jgi:hypothetical protein
VRIAPGLDLKASRQARERILNKRFDFVLCERNNREPIAVIELTEGAQRIASGNDWTAQVCAKVGLKLLRFDVQQSYSLGELRQQLGLSCDADDVVARIDERVRLVRHDVSRDATAPLCPECSGRMVVRQASQGVRAGVLLWSCSHDCCAGEVSFDQWLAC